MKQTLMACVSAFLLVVTTAVHAEEGTTAPKATADQKATIVALELMNSTLGKNMQKADARLDMMREYLKEQGLVESFAKAQADTDAKPALLGYEDALATAVKHVEENEVAAEAEFDNISVEQADRDIAGLKTLTQPRFEELQRTRGTIQRISTYLKDDEKLANYMSWATDQQGEEKAAEEKQMDENREKDIAESKAEHEKFEQTKARVDQQKHDDHQAELQRKFELQEQSMQDEATVQAAKYSGGGYDPYWYGGWNDPYHDIVINNHHHNHPLHPLVPTPPKQGE